MMGPLPAFDLKGGVSFVSKRGSFGAPQTRCCWRPDPMGIVLCLLAFSWVKGRTRTSFMPAVRRFNGLDASPDPDRGYLDACN